jgi:hypothetical protein
MLDLAFLFFAVRALREDAAPSARARTIVVLLSPLVAAIRYEGAFLVLIVAVFFFAKRRLKDAFLVAAVGALPIVVFGVVSLVHGWYFFPNSVLLKAQWLGGLPTVSTVKQLLSASVRAEKVMLDTPHVFVLVIASLALLVMQLHREGFWTAAALWNTAFVAMCLLHLQFAGTGWFFRYESYLVALGLVVLAITAPRIVWFRQLMAAGRGHTRLPSYLAAAALAALLGFPLISRAGSALIDTPAATANIYQQQYQMGQFVRAAYAGKAIAANDIGVISFLNDGPLLDLAGLASLDVAKAQRADHYDAAVMQQLAKEQDIKIAILYEEWFSKGGIPKDWRKVGQWTIPNRVAAAKDTVSFYAVESDDEESLIENLRRFAGRLPKVVVQKGKYTEPPLENLAQSP